MTQQIELAPLRSIDDFLLGSARFQLPNFNDLDKWGNRVTKNFLYYQTNYFVLGFIVSAMFVLHDPLLTIFGLAAWALIIAAFVVINPNQRHRNAQQDTVTGWLYLGGIVFTTSFVLYLFQSIMYVTLIALLPFCIAFVHASLRLRNLRNKLSNVIDEKFRHTPMGVFLEAMSIAVDSISK